MTDDEKIVRDAKELQERRPELFRFIHALGQAHHAGQIEGEAVRVKHYGSGAATTSGDVGSSVERILANRKS